MDDVFLQLYLYLLSGQVNILRSIPNTKLIVDTVLNQTNCCFLS